MPLASQNELTKIEGHRACGWDRGKERRLDWVSAGQVEFAAEAQDQCPGFLAHVDRRRRDNSHDILLFITPPVTKGRGPRLLDPRTRIVGRRPCRFKTA